MVPAHLCNSGISWVWACIVLVQYATAGPDLLVGMHQRNNKKELKESLSRNLGCVTGFRFKEGGFMKWEKYYRLHSLSMVL